MWQDSDMENKVLPNFNQVIIQ